MTSGFETGQSIGNSRASFGGTVSIGKRSSKFLRYKRSKEASASVEATLTGCELDGFLKILPSAGKSSWAACIDATESGQAADDEGSEAGHIQVSRGNFGTTRFYFRFNGGAFAAGISSVSAATLKVYCTSIDNDPDTDVNKWKAFKHNDITSSNLAVGNFRNDNNSAGWNTSISGDEATVTGGAYISFPITGDLLSYVSTQAQSQADVAFMLVCKLDYGETAPTGIGAPTFSLTPLSGTSQDPKLDYTYS
tara:strand:+ start:762 stop:1514 length:753 start_codon:yes stop_codon:yes gene_type:complete